MEDKQNSPLRILAIATKAREVAGNRSGLKVWSQVFDLSDGTDEADRTWLVSDYLSAVASELKAIEEAMRLQEVPQELYQQYINNFRSAFSVSGLGATWANHAGTLLGVDTLLAMRWVAHVLPGESIVATQASLQELTDQLAELEALLDSDGVPSQLAHLTKRHLSHIRNAMKLLAIKGVAALREAERKVLADFHVDADEIRIIATQGEAEAVNKVGEKFRAVWTKAATITGDIEKMANGSKAVIETFSSIQSFLPSS